MPSIKKSEYDRLKQIEANYQSDMHQAELREQKLSIQLQERNKQLEIAEEARTRADRTAGNAERQVEVLTAELNAMREKQQATYKAVCEMLQVSPADSGFLHNQFSY